MLPASAWSAPASAAATHHATSIDRHRPRYHSVSGHDDQSWYSSSSCCSPSDDDDDDDVMTSSPPGHMMGVVTSSSPPRQLSVSDLFTYQCPPPRSPPCRLPPSVAASSRPQHHPAANALSTHHVMLADWPEPEIEDDAEQRPARRLPTSWSFDDSAIDNLSAPSTSSAGSRGRNVDQSASCAESRDHVGSTGAAHGQNLTRSIAVIPCSSLMTSQTNMAALRKGQGRGRRSRGKATLTHDTDAMTVYKI